MFRYAGHRYHRCVACGHVSTFPIPAPEVLARHYAAKSADGNYRVLRDHAADYVEVYEGFANHLAGVLTACGRSLRGARVLDVGCFTGEFLECLVRRGADVRGIELQAEAAAIAAARLGGRVVHGDVSGADLGAERFEAITLLGVIEHVTAPVAVLRQCAELLEPGGVLMLQTPDSSSGFAQLMGRWWPPYAPVEHIHLFGRRSLQLVLEQLGFVHLRFALHWKRLSLGYVYEMLRSFGPEFHRVLRPVHAVTPVWLWRAKCRLTVGEMLVTARKG